MIPMGYVIGGLALGYATSILFKKDEKELTPEVEKSISNIEAINVPTPDENANYNSNSDNGTDNSPNCVPPRTDTPETVIPESNPQPEQELNNAD